jgi:hypothetical protein
MGNYKSYWLLITVLVVFLVGPLGCSKPAQAEFNLISLDITPPEVVAGDPVSVAACVKNIGDSEGIYSATLMIDGAVVEKKEVSVAPNDMQTITFSLTKDRAGTYNIAVGELSANLIVKPTPIQKEVEEGLRNPKYNEAVAFIKSDNTSNKVSRDHALAAMLVVENAAKQGIKGYWIIVRVPGYSPTSGLGFNFVGFNTVDRGWVYFCTTSICAQDEIKIEIGRKLYQSNPSWPNPGFDDTATSIHSFPLDNGTWETLRDPTYEDAASFINEDHTNEVTQDNALSSMLVIENAAKQGIKGYWVILQTPGYSETNEIGVNCVGFNTTDRGWIYFGSITHKELKAEVGKKLTKLNPWIGTLPFDDTISSIHHLPL